MINQLTLPFDYDDLIPFMSRESLRIHYLQHHRSHVLHLNKAINGTRFAEMALNDIVQQSEGAIFKSAALVWNHNFFWHCLSPTCTEPELMQANSILESLEDSFKSLQEFKQEFSQIATTLYGSAWVWLVQSMSGALSIVVTQDSETPIVDPNTFPVLALDMWEHAYYLDYQGKSAGYVQNFWKFVNWQFVGQNLELVTDLRDKPTNFSVAHRIN